MKQIIPYLRPYRAQMGLGMLLIALSSVCSLLLPTLMSDILNRGVYLSDLEDILSCCVKMLLVTLISLAAILGGNYFSARVVSGFCADLRAAVFGKVNTMTFEEVSRRLWLRFDTKEAYECASDELNNIIRESDGRDIVVIYIAEGKLKKELPRSMTVNGSELLEVLRARFGADNVKLV